MSDSDFAVLLTQDQHDMNLHEDTDRPIYFTRLAARAVMRNEKDQIAVMYFTKSGSYKLPGGGIDDHEEIVAALHREVEEETGYRITNISPIGIVEENRYFCGMHQKSYCFTARSTEFVGAKLTDQEAAEGMTLRWASSVDEAIDWVKSSNTIDEGFSTTGLAMMKARDIAILNASRRSVDAK